MNDLFKTIDSVLAPRATAEQEARYMARLNAMTPEERATKQAEWDREYRKYRRSVLRNLIRNS